MPEPAFPRPPVVATGPVHTGGQTGMSLLDYFAAKCLTGYLANPQFDKSLSHETVAICCYTMAQAMMEERKNHIG
jgi:hypothetical protein